MHTFLSFCVSLHFQNYTSLPTEPEQEAEAQGQPTTTTNNNKTNKQTNKQNQTKQLIIIK